METIFTASDKLGDIVSKLPKASEIFKQYNIDFCCGGQRPLAAAIQEQKLNEGEILAALEQAYQEAESVKQDTAKDWRQTSYSELIDHIVNTHHAYLNQELPRLSENVTKILRVHGVHHGAVLSKVHKLFHSLKMDLEQHLIKEEEILFPLIKEYEKNPTDSLLPKIRETIQDIENEHTAAGDILKEIRSITEQYVTPADACTTFRSTYQRLEELESDLFQHIHLENNILFPRLGMQV